MNLLNVISADRLGKLGEVVSRTSTNDISKLIDTINKQLFLNSKISNDRGSGIPLIDRYDTIKNALVEELAKRGKDGQ